jgi:hypothetical protein
VCADGLPLVVSEPAGPVAAAFMELGATVVREVAKLSVASKHGMTWDEQQQLMRVVLPGTSTGSAPSAPFYLQPAVVRRHDTSARSINEWTGESLGAGDVPDDIKPLSVSPVGNYAVQIQWEDGFNQVGCTTSDWQTIDAVRYCSSPCGIAARCCLHLVLCIWSSLDCVMHRTCRSE